MDYENKPYIGTQGVSKVVSDALVDTLTIVISAIAPAMAPLTVAGATVLKGVGPLLQDMQDRNIGLLVEEGSHQVGMNVTDFVAAVTSNPDRLLLFASACDAARRTVIDDKIKALGQAVANLSNDDALVDESAIWISIFSQVDAPHIRMISALCEMDPETEGHIRLWKRNELAQKCGLTSTVSVLITTLTSLGLMRERPYEELDAHTRARWGANRPGSAGSPLYGKGPLTDDFMNKLKMQDVAT